MRYMPRLLVDNYKTVNLRQFTYTLKHNVHELWQSNCVYRGSLLVAKIYWNLIEISVPGLNCFAGRAISIPAFNKSVKFSIMPISKLNEYIV